MATKLTKKTKSPIKPVKKVAPQKKKQGRVEMKAPKNHIYALGRRKSASARVMLFKGKEEILVNGQPISQYWSKETLKSLYQEPFRVTNTLDIYTATAKIKGSGTKGQIGAFVHAVSRALDKLDPEKNRPILRKHGLLTRDPRMKETRKVGRGGKARAKKQSPKR